MYSRAGEQTADSAQFPQGNLQSVNPASWDAAEPSMFDDVVYKLQDKNIDLKRVIQAIRDAGAQIPEKYDAYRQEELSEAGTEALDAILSDETVSDDEIADIPFGDEIPVDQAAMDAYFGVTNEERNDGQTDGTAGREQAQGAEGGQEGRGNAQGFALESHTNQEVLDREGRREQYPERHGFKKLWDGSEPASAGHSENPSGQTTPNARGQSDSTIPQQAEQGKAEALHRLSILRAFRANSNFLQSALGHNTSSGRFIDR